MIVVNDLWTMFLTVTISIMDGGPPSEVWCRSTFDLRGKKLKRHGTLCPDDLLIRELLKDREIKVKKMFW